MEDEIASLIKEVTGLDEKIQKKNKIIQETQKILAAKQLELKKLREAAKKKLAEVSSEAEAEVEFASLFSAPVPDVKYRAFMVRMDNWNAALKTIQH